MMKENEQKIPLVDGNAMPWEKHPRIQNIFMKALLTSTDNPLANISLVRVPVGSAVSRHHHANEVETVYLLSGKSDLVLGDERVPFNAGSVVAIPKGLEHELHNVGDEPVELLAFFTPPLA
jgi:mannose-6-phosphate isomerase-like protein (cupin superfamily)